MGRARIKPIKWEAESLAGGVTRVTFEWRLWVYVSSDWHWDSVHCDRERLASDLATAKRLNAAVLSLGDLFDVMGGKFDPRGSKDGLRSELCHGNYFDQIVDQSAEWLRPYASQLALITPGNHETAIRKRQETCLTTRLVERLRQMGSPVRQGGYAGWLMLRAIRGPNKRRDRSTGTGSPTALHRLWYHHGYGGGGPVTRGVIDFSRYLSDVDADSVVAGHVHQRTLIEASRQRLSPNGIPRVRPMFLVRSASYKSESVTDGWAVEKGMSSRPLGGWWLLLRWNTERSEIVASYHDRPTEGDEDYGRSTGGIDADA